MAGDTLRGELESRFGPLRETGRKPFSIHYRNADDTVLVKLYRGIDPTARAARETDALHTAERLGVPVPRPLGTGEDGTVAWLALPVLAATPLALRSAADARTFAATARAVLAPLHADRTSSGPGTGWTGPGHAATSAHLAAQLRDQFSALPTWPRLRASLGVLDALPVARLHGDVKPDHLLIDRNRGVTVVDWEACHRGPAILDEADIAFRVVREVIYGELKLTATDVAALCRSPAHAVALMWRLAVWLDRRHDAFTRTVATLVESITTLPDSADPFREAVEIARTARQLGTPY